MSRNKRAFASFCFITLWLLTLTLPGTLHAASWKAGVGRVQITPQQFMWMAGYAHRSQPADDFHADLWAKALVLEDPNGQRGVLISLDLIGIDRQLSQTVSGRLQQQFDVRRDQLALCCSHTHTGPVVGKCLEPLHYRQLDETQRRLVDEYEGRLVGYIVECVATAIDDLRPCRLAWGSGLATFAVNRRNNSEAAVPALRASGTLKGPVDHDVPVLAVRDDEGSLRAVVFGYACHATVLSDYGWSGDYPGFAAAELESRCAGCTALFWAGCGADQNPVPRRQLELAQGYGHQLAEAVTAVLQGVMQPIEGALTTSYTEVPLALDKLPGKSEIEQAVTSENKYERARAALLLTQIAHDGSLAQTYPYPIGRWQLGDQIDFVFLGGEVVVDYALRLKAERHGRRTWVAGYTNDVMAYIPSERVLHEGGYEGLDAMVYYGLPAGWAEGVEKTIIDVAVRQTVLVHERTGAEQ